jgi:polygalacturonase
MFLKSALLTLFLFVYLASNVASAAVPTLPNINTNNIVNITNYGAIGDGVATNTTAIQTAINAASAGTNTNGLFGGVVKFPAGIYLSGPLSLKNNVNLQFDAGAILRMLPLFKYPGGTNATTDFITGSSLTNLAFTGTGAIDGQGLPWWQYVTSNWPISRPTMISLSTCSRVLFEDLTLSNSPQPHIGIKGNNAGNVTIQRLTITAPSSSAPLIQRSHNTDAIDLAETNGLIQDCTISVGDDNVAMGSSGGLTRDVVITNCAFGTGHGVSIGSFTASGVSNITVINCTFNGTDNPIRLKSDNNLHGSSRGGLVQNLSYLNLGMTNVNNAAIMIYSYYNVVGTPTSISPATAVSETVDPVGQYTPIWRNITISNITATVAGSGIAGIIWGRTEMPATNIVMDRVNITAQKTFDVYNAYGIQFRDCRITNTGGGQKTLTLWNAGVVLSNTASSFGVITVDGTNNNSGVNSLALYNSKAALTFSNALALNPITLSGGTLTVSNNLSLSSATKLNFTLGTSNSQINITGDADVSGTFNFANGAGFAPGAYTVLTYSNSLSGFPTLGATPSTGHAYFYSLDTNTPRQINFVVATPPPPIITDVRLSDGTNLVISGSNGTTNFNFFVLASTNLSLPLPSWTRVATNEFMPDGTFTVTNSIVTDTAGTFFVLQYP